MFLTTILALLIMAGAGAQELTIVPEDLKVELRADGGFHLFIRKKPGIASVLLTETTRDPLFRSDNYAYRAKEWNQFNGDEVRMLDGVPIPRESGVYSLIDSSPETDKDFGEAFHIYVPYVLEYGYPWSRHGEAFVTDGMYINIRAFALPYGDYRGAFKDNPFTVEVSQLPAEDKPKGDYLKETVDSFTEISSGKISWSTGKEDVVAKIEEILKNGAGKTVDLVICLDATGSMKPHIDPVRSMLIPMLQKSLNDFKSFRIGMVLYKDYRDEYLHRVIGFTKDFSVFQRNLNAIKPSGGGDIPEAVYEALHEAAVKFPWEAEERIIILIGDAPPHPEPRGRITKEMVENAAEKHALKINAIILPES